MTVTLQSHILTLLLLLLLLLLSTPIQALDRKLKFNEEGKFKIVQFTDLHYGYNEEENSKTALVQEKILETERPDLVVITGDLVSGYEWKGGRGWIEELWLKLTAPMIKYNVRWAVALGNHDVEGDLTGKAIAELDITYDLSLTELGPSDVSGATNFYLPIYSNDSTSYSTSDIGQILWIFDSGSNGCLGVKGWGCIMHDQVEWYRNASQYLSSSKYEGRKRPIPSLAFFHIPLYEHLDLWNVHPVQGDLGEGEGVCCSAVNTGLYAAMKEIGDIKGVYCGHDHSNDFIGDYHGISLGYGRKTGYGCYGPPMGWQHGARVLEITQNEFGAKTWLRLEDGTVEIQKHHSVSWRKFLGCCSMEGHGRVAMTWLNLLALFAYIAVFVCFLSLCLRSLYRYYKRRKGRPILSGGILDDGDENESNSNDILHTWELKKLTHFWAAKAPRPRLRRVNELDSV